MVSPAMSVCMRPPLARRGLVYGLVLRADCHAIGRVGEHETRAGAREEGLDVGGLARVAAHEPVAAHGPHLAALDARRRRLGRLVLDDVLGVGLALGFCETQRAPVELGEVVHV